ncbi:hypothetical protein HR45_06805 [Shewanella mangrovi]|uniref:Flagella basal body P-ring formation protein FlgA n=1 Tax=Shewanella mangrovi TaxID=1515746 RepID=A0A094LSN9_9GAMM|nr:flagellar basal body P-ring formation chaperone FlgA [Shewanella mangrovi]KFZ38203.1 hypothetical protein HR45_06805 [Shewanella mangrovi]
MKSFDVILGKIREAFLPLRKHNYWLLPLAIFSCQLHATNSLEQALNAHVQQELKQYQQQHSFTAHKQRISFRIADAATQRPCNHWQFSRPNANQAPLGRVGYRIECVDNERWTSRAIAEVHLWADVLVATKALERDTQIALADIKLSSVDLAKVNAEPLFAPLAAANKLVRRRIHAGQVISAYLLENPMIVKRGDIVTMVVDIDGFSASTRGTAMEDAKLGERVKVKNNSSGKVVEGKVLKGGQVAVDFIGN